MIVFHDTDLVRFFRLFKPFFVEQLGYLIFSEEMEYEKKIDCSDFRRILPAEEGRF